MCLLCIMASAASIALDDLRAGSSVQLEKPGVDGESNGDVGWGRLTSSYPDFVAWLEVEGTPISLPVVQPPPEKPRDWYLTHNAEGAWDALGCPYLDARTDVRGRNLLVFAHHRFGSDLMFSPLVGAQRKEVFDSLGSARLSMPDGSIWSFRPLCALEVDASFQAIQRFSFPGRSEFRSWLSDLAKEASTESEEANALIRSAERVLTLVTCSSPIPGQRWRTIVIFAAI